MKVVRFFGRAIPLTTFLSVLTLLGIASLVTAKVLTHFAITNATITVKPAISVSKDGESWHDAPATLTYELGEIVAGQTKTFNAPLYIRNNLPVEGEWDYVYFDYKYTYHKDLLDAINYIKLSYTTYPSTEEDPGTCDNSATLSGDVLRSHATCNGDSCTILRSDIVGELDKLGEGMIQKFCGVEISLRPDAVGGTYTITTEILPAE